MSSKFWGPTCLKTEALVYAKVAQVGVSGEGITQHREESAGHLSV